MKTLIMKLQCMYEMQELERKSAKIEFGFIKFKDYMIQFLDFVEGKEKKNKGEKKHILTIGCWQPQKSKGMNGKLESLSMLLARLPPPH